VNIKQIVLNVLACCAFASSISSCAAQQTYNPDNLDGEQLARVAGICQNVIGLSPTESLVGGYWTNNDRLEYSTSKYRGCIISLSDSLRGAMDERATIQSDGLAMVTLVREGEPRARESYTYSSPREVARRQEMACAALGLELSRPAFNGCVQGLSNTFYAIDHPIN
jgi:hypothetical protein